MTTPDPLVTVSGARVDQLIRDMDQYAALTTNTPMWRELGDTLRELAMRRAADALAAQVQSHDAALFQWMAEHPDECASAVNDAYEAWSPFEEEGRDFASHLEDQIAHQKTKLARAALSKLEPQR